MFVVNRLETLINLLKKRKMSIAVAESCSAGYLSYLLTKVPGSSKVFKGSIVVYNLKAKNKFFKIPYSLLEKTEGVSDTVAVLLAKGVRKIFNADLGASLVGFAGPETKKGIKVGTVFMSLVGKKGGWVKRIVLRGNRDKVRSKASLLLIDLIYKHLCKQNKTYTKIKT
jgi:nicotinamide-nucleotide amidase